MTDLTVNLDLRGLAGVLAADKGGLEDGVLVGAEAGDGLVKAFEHGARAHLVGQAGGGVDLGAVDRGGDVDGQEVTIGGRAVDGLQRAEAAAEFVEGLVDVGVGGLCCGNLNLDAGVVGQLDLGADVNLGVELEFTVGGGRVRNLGDLDLGTAQRADAGFLDGGLVPAVEAFVDGCFQDVAAADALVDQLGGDLALTEARDLDLRSNSLVCLCRCWASIPQRGPQH